MGNKRRSENGQMRREEYENARDNSESAGTFQRASAAELGRRRKIRPKLSKVKEAKKVALDKGSALFQNVNLTAPSSGFSFGGTAVGSSALGDFASSTAPPPAASTPFQFGSSSSSSPSTSTGFSFGAASSSKEKKESTAAAVPNKSTFVFGKQAASPSAFSFGSAAPATAPSAAPFSFAAPPAALPAPSSSNNNVGGAPAAAPFSFESKKPAISFGASPPAPKNPTSTTEESKLEESAMKEKREKLELSFKEKMLAEDNPDCCAILYSTNMEAARIWKEYCVAVKSSQKSQGVAAVSAAAPTGAPKISATAASTAAPKNSATAASTGAPEVVNGGDQDGEQLYTAKEDPDWDDVGSFPIVSIMRRIVVDGGSKWSGAFVKRTRLRLQALKVDSSRHRMVVRDGLGKVKLNMSIAKGSSYTIADIGGKKGPSKMIIFKGINDQTVGPETFGVRCTVDVGPDLFKELQKLAK